MRADSMGMFWFDEPPPPKVKVEKIKRLPPERTWERPDYLPFLDEVNSAVYDFYTDEELIRAAINREPLEYDIECYINYLLIAFKGFYTGKIVYVEMTPEQPLDIRKLRWIIENFTTVGFNSLNYDNTICTLAIAGLPNEELKRASDLIITGDGSLNEHGKPVGMPGYRVLQHYGISAKAMNLKFFRHIDLMPVAPRRASLKIYAGRLHIERIQDLPFPHTMWLSPEHIRIMRWYCINDLKATELLHRNLLPQIELREKMGQRYGLDLLSKADPQIAEAIFVSQTKAITGQKHLQKPVISNYAGSSFLYQWPAQLQFNSATMQYVKHIITNALFKIDSKGYVKCDDVQGIVITIAGTEYTMGIGGLHSKEKSRYFRTTATHQLEDFDVTSYYPKIILNAGLYPLALGATFLNIYETIVNERVAAKHSKNKVVADSLKIVINGSFGKFGDPYSYLYSPNLLIQTTLTGQLSLLMLIERLELQNINVVSANTDGLILYYEKNKKDLVMSIVEQWQKDTGLELEGTPYKAVYSRDINAYFAIDNDNKIKGKGIFADVSLEITPDYDICQKAVMNYFAHGTPIEQTINECADITQFVKLRQIAGGAVKDGEYLGKVVRYYRSSVTDTEIIYANTGNKVPMSDKCNHLQLLPKTMPSDVDKEWYIENSYKVLRAIGYD